MGIDADIVEYTLGERSRAAGQMLARMALPDSTVVAMITRSHSVIPPRGSTKLEAGDHLFVVLRPDVRELVDLIFSNSIEVSADEFPQQEVALKGTTTLADIYRSFGIHMQGNPTATLEDLFREGRDEPRQGAKLLVDGVTLTIRGMVGGRIATVGLLYEHPYDSSTNTAPAV